MKLLNKRLILCGQRYLLGKTSDHVVAIQWHQTRLMASLKGLSKKHERAVPELKIRNVHELDPHPEFINERQVMWDELKAVSDAWIASQVPEPIKIYLPDGRQIDGLSWRTTPFDVASEISKGPAEKSIVAKVNGEMWDLERPLEKSSHVQILGPGDAEAQAVFWHSTAHVLGEALERIYGGLLCYGPPIENGFYYDMFSCDKKISENDFPAIEDLMKTIIKEKQPFQRLVMKKSDLMQMFGYNKFKTSTIEEKVDTTTSTVYRCGTLIDLCLGPHIRDTGKIKAFSLTKSSGAYWKGNSELESLQRVYGISFTDPKLLKEWKELKEEAAKRDHRKLGREQELFFFHELSAGSCFFLPKGAHIYNKLTEFIKEEYWKRGFQEVISPNIFSSKLWQTSGHWEHYADNMFSFDVEKDTYGLKPMNCPGHCLIFDHSIRSWRDLPLRLADFGVLHRNEFSGALTGLTRLRRFQQDDAHIFCRRDQIRKEIQGALEFLQHVYNTLGFTYSFKLSTRPEKYLGDIEVWNQAEQDLAESLDAQGLSWKLNPGDGAFYGPKIDITLTDALKRQHQCATIQLDFQLPIRFNLSYIDEKGDKSTPVIIHRAILGSVERLIAILLESNGGKWPFWISPRQAIVVPVSPVFNDYAIEVQQKIFSSGFCCNLDVDESSTMNKKVRNAQLAQYNFVLVVGEKEKKNSTVNIRTRGNEVLGEQPVDFVLENFTKLATTRALTTEEIEWKI